MMILTQAPQPTVPLTPEHTFAWIVLRLAFSWLFLYPILDLIRDWAGTIKMASIIIPFAPRIAALATLVSMILGATSILLGYYPTLGGAMLLIYCLLGGYVHWVMATQIQALELTSQASSANKIVLDACKKSALYAHISSGQKNVVLAALALFFMMAGTGPLSLGGF